MLAYKLPIETNHLQRTYNTLNVNGVGSSDVDTVVAFRTRLLRESDSLRLCTPLHFAVVSWIYYYYWSAGSITITGQLDLSDLPVSWIYYYYWIYLVSWINFVCGGLCL